MTLSHAQALEIARSAAASSAERHAYLPKGFEGAKDFMPHRWVIDAMMVASTMRVPEGMNLVPHYRGYALLGVGAYLINHTAADADLGAEVVISVATEDEKAGRVIGDERDNEPGGVIQPEDMAVRIGFKNVAGLDALENQLRHLRRVHFPESVSA